MGLTALKETTQTLQKLESLNNLDVLANATDFILNPAFSSNPYGPPMFTEFPEPFQIGPYASGEVHVIIARQTLTENYSTQRQAFDQAFVEKISSITSSDLKYKRTSTLLNNIMIEEFKVNDPTQLTAIIAQFGIANAYATQQAGENPTFIRRVILGSNDANLETTLQGIDTSWGNWSSEIRDGWDGIFSQVHWDSLFATGDQLVLNLLGNGQSDNVNYVTLSDGSTYTPNARV